MIYLFNLASRHNDWLSTRQATVAGNIANANTPGYRARDVEPFEDAMAATKLEMARTAPSHIQLASLPAQPVDAKEADVWEVTYSGNSVSLDQEMMKAGEVQRSFSLNAGLAKSFHRMLLMAAKG